MDEYWAILTDKGYQGAAEDIRVGHPVRTPARATLSLEDVEYNRCSTIPYGDHPAEMITAQEDG